MPYCGRRGGPPSTKIVDAAKSDASIGVSIGEKTAALAAHRGGSTLRLSGRKEFFICQRLAAPSIVAARRIRGGARDSRSRRTLVQRVTEIKSVCA